MKTKYKIDGVWYEWYGGFGAVLISQEYRDVRVGDVRIIKSTPMYAYIVRKNIFGCRHISWSIYKTNDTVRIGDIEAFKRKLV